VNNTIPRYGLIKIDIFAPKVLERKPGGEYIKAKHLDVLHEMIEKAYDFAVSGRVAQARGMLDQMKIYLNQTHKEDEGA
jgi:hypothetical protein